MSPMIPGRNKLTVYDVQNLKGKEQIMMTASGDIWVAKIAEAAGMHILRCWGWGADEESMTQNSQEPGKASHSRLGMGLAIGIALGLAIGTALDNIGVGLAIGIALGAGIGASWDRRGGGTSA